MRFRFLIFLFTALLSILNEGLAYTAGFTPFGPGLDIKANKERIESGEMTVEQVIPMNDPYVNSINSLIEGVDDAYENKYVRKNPYPACKKFENSKGCITGLNEKVGNLDEIAEDLFLGQLQSKVISDLEKKMNDMDEFANCAFKKTGKQIIANSIEAQAYISRQLKNVNQKKCQDEEAYQAYKQKLLQNYLAVRENTIVSAMNGDVINLLNSKGEVNDFKSLPKRIRIKGTKAYIKPTKADKAAVHAAFEILSVQAEEFQLEANKKEMNDVLNKQHRMIHYGELGSGYEVLQSLSSSHVYRNTSLSGSMLKEFVGREFKKKDKEKNCEEEGTCLTEYKYRKAAEKSLVMSHLIANARKKADIEKFKLMFKTPELLDLPDGLLEDGEVDDGDAASILTVAAIGISFYTSPATGLMLTTVIDGVVVMDDLVEGLEAQQLVAAFEEDDAYHHYKDATSHYKAAATNTLMAGFGYTVGKSAKKKMMQPGRDGLDRLASVKSAKAVEKVAETSGSRSFAINGVEIQLDEAKMMRLNFSQIADDFKLWEKNVRKGRDSAIEIPNDIHSFLYFKTKLVEPDEKHLAEIVKRLRVYQLIKKKNPGVSAADIIKTNDELRNYNYTPEFLDSLPDLLSWNSSNKDLAKVLGVNSQKATKEILQRKLDRLKGRIDYAVDLRGGAKEKLRDLLDQAKESGVNPVKIVDWAIDNKVGDVIKYPAREVNNSLKMDDFEEVAKTLKETGEESSK